MASFGNNSFDLDSFSELAFFFDAISTGVKHYPKKKRQLGSEAEFRAKWDDRDLIDIITMVLPRL